LLMMSKKRYNRGNDFHCSQSSSLGKGFSCAKSYVTKDSL